MLKNKTVLITGGTGYLGQEICRAFHGYGARVLFSFHEQEQTARKMCDELPGAKAVALDLRNVPAINATVEGLYREVGTIDILVNNAAISQTMPLAMLEEEDVDLAMDINIKGPLFLTRAVIKGMIRNQRGAIVNMGSIAGHRLLDVPVTYAVTKSAMAGFTLALAAELKSFGIRVNAVVPGLLEGGVSHGVPDAMRRDFIEHCATGRAGTAREVAEAVCFLGSDRASYINGQLLFVDGGI
jgi:NAD(P)-dependent dehydrogenase (short-subunit alcohol dehydrogenase family)